jgi:hypothetical protein
MAACRATTLSCTGPDAWAGSGMITTTTATGCSGAVPHPSMTVNFTLDCVAKTVCLEKCVGSCCSETPGTCYALDTAFFELPSTLNGSCSGIGCSLR